MRLCGYAEYSVSSVKAKRPYNHITLKPKKLKPSETSVIHVSYTQQFMVSPDGKQVAVRVDEVHLLQPGLELGSVTLAEQPSCIESVMI